MSDYGIKTSRIGYDVDTASDRQLAFSSDWPLLPIEYENTYTWAIDTEDQTYAHGLGYPPVVIGWFEDTNGNVYSSEYYIALTVDSTYVYIPGIPTTYEYIGGEWVEVPLEEYVGWKVHIKIFRRSLLSVYTGANINVTDATPDPDEDYGIHVSLPGKDVDSTDDRDFCVRSDRRQLILHQSGITDYTEVRYFDFTVSSSSTGNTLVSTTPVFSPLDVWTEITNTTDFTSTMIIEYINDTTVKVLDTIGDTWDGDAVTSGSATLSVYHNLGYSPMFFSFLNYSGSDLWQVFNSGADDAYISVTDESLIFTTFYDGLRWAYLIFKDTLTENG